MSDKCLYCYGRLAGSDANGYHERCSLEFFGTREAPLLDYSLDQMAELARVAVRRSVTVPGVQPKISLSLIREALNRGNTGRLTVVGALGGNFILKPPTEHYPELPQNEHVTMRIAESFGIRTVKSGLMRLQSGELTYITRRLDRTESGEKVHMLDMFQVLEAVDKYRSSMEKIGGALDLYSQNILLDKLYLFELTVFSFLTGNNDMHLKNFSMIHNGNAWGLAPAYDLLNATIANPGDTEELALPIEGKKRKLKRGHFERFGARLELNRKQVEGVFQRFVEGKPAALGWISASFLSEEFREKYRALLDARYSVLPG